MEASLKDIEIANKLEEAFCGVSGDWCQSWWMLPPWDAIPRPCFRGAQVRRGGRAGESKWRETTIVRIRKEKKKPLLNIYDCETKLRCSHIAPILAYFNTRLLKPGNECYPHQHDLYWDKWPVVHLGVCQHQIKRDDIRKDDLWSPCWFVARGRWSCFSLSLSIETGRREMKCERGRNKEEWHFRRGLCKQSTALSNTDTLSVT